MNSNFFKLLTYPQGTSLAAQRLRDHLPRSHLPCSQKAKKKITGRGVSRLGGSCHLLQGIRKKLCCVQGARTHGGFLRSVTGSSMKGCRCEVSRDGEQVLVQVHGLPSSTAPEATVYPCDLQRTLQQGSSLQKPHRG